MRSADRVWLSQLRVWSLSWLRPLQTWNRRFHAGFRL